MTVSSSTATSGPAMSRTITAHAIVRWLAVAAALGVAGQWLAGAAERVVIPFPLEWQEGVVVTHATRLLVGEPIYTAPAADFVPSIYPPLGYVVDAAAMLVLGPGLPAARFVSVLATLLVALVLGIAVCRATGSLPAAIVAGGLYLGAYALEGSWYDLARCDALFVLFAVSALALLTAPLEPGAERPLRAHRIVAAAIVTALAVLTKQQGIGVAASCLLYLAMTDLRLALLFSLITAGLVTVPVVVLEQASDGWFLRYTWTLLTSHPRHLDRIPSAVLAILTSASVPLALSAAWTYRRVRGREGWVHFRRTRPTNAVWAIALAAFGAMALMSMIKEGGAPNHLMPVMAIGAGMSGFLAGEVERSGRQRWPQLLVPGLVLVQLALWQLPERPRPRLDLIAAQAALVDSLAAIQGDVLVLEDAYYGILAGHRPNADASALRYLGFSGLDIPPDLAERITHREYAAVVLSDRAGARHRSLSHRRLHELIAENYAFERELVPLPDCRQAKLLRIPTELYRPVAPLRGAAASVPNPLLH